jgi:hypothetical protein
MGLNSQKRGICQQTWDLFFPWEDDFATNYGFFSHRWKKPKVRCENFWWFADWISDVGNYPLVMTNIAMENDPFIDGLPGFTY